MIFVTVHQVVDSNERKGINLYVYESKARPPLHNDVVDATAAQESPGELKGMDIAVKPGGNRIPAFLDVACTEYSDADEVESLLETMRERLGSQLPPVSEANSRAGIAFNSDIGLHARAPETLGQLGRAALRALREKLKPLGSDPVIVIVTEDNDSFTFELTTETAQRVAKLRGPSWHATKITIAQETKAAFETMLGSMFNHLPMLLTSLDEYELLQMGGVRYVSAGDPARVIRQWPPPSG